MPANRCEICGVENDAQALFCKGCTAPLGVVSLSELGEADHRACLSALVETLTDAGTSDASMPDDHDPELWNAYLSAFWLRPETAIILYAESLAIARLSNRLGEPWLDLGCGDGIRSAISGGWRFGPNFDAFQSVDLSAADIYHQWNPSEFSAPIERRGRSIAFGVDIKDTAVSRAKALGIYGAVHQADATRLPLADKSVRTIFSNMLRDLGDPLPGALRECRRVLRDDGILLISAMTPAYRRNLYFEPRARAAEAEGNLELAKQFLRLDRGRSVFCQRQLSVEQWQNVLGECGMKVIDVAPIVGPAVIRFLDVGLRPFSIALLKLRKRWIEHGILDQIKPIAMDGMTRFLDWLLKLRCVGEPCMNLLAVGKA